MNYGLNISASGALTSLYRQDVLANNLANLNTVGFKPDVPEIRHRDPARIEDGLFHLPSNELIEILGAGVIPGPSRISFAQGDIQTTGEPLDLAIEGDGFLVVDAGEGELALTRDGRLTINADRELVMATSGLPVLNDAGQPITIPNDTAVTINTDGEIIQDGGPVGRIRLADLADRQALAKIGEGLFGVPPQAIGALTRASGRLVQGAVEGSAVNEIRAMLDVQAASRAVGTNIGMMTYADRMMERAINTFGRTSA